ncbi:hypothetical protein RND81_12G221300 [Saponaria officinalis]|uniref:Uncharacterized protein n=1 Tax=Saponaria officinalis TaxID=3572 RepID=A0AAW1HDY7_SAPOF
MLVKTKDRMKQELLNVVQPLYEVCKLHGYKVCTEISEAVQVADLRRMSLGSRFIGRSHLIWAFYKLGYVLWLSTTLPLEIRNTINVFDSDEDHPPYHIYMAALKLALCSGEKMMQLDHFVFAVLHSKDIDSDGEWATEFYQHFKDFQKGIRFTFLGHSVPFRSDVSLPLVRIPSGCGLTIMFIVVCIRSFGEHGD